MNDKELDEQILKFLERIIETIGEPTNEYTWREAIGLAHELKERIDKTK